LDRRVVDVARSEPRRGPDPEAGYLIIGGVPKSATTSLFRYLADHPQVCPASRKETYFFAREFDYKHVCQAEETTDAFAGYFGHCGSSSRLRIEATPYTLYSRHAAERIAGTLPNAMMLFLLRDPVDRFLSDYHFHVQREHPSVRGSLRDFVEKQLRYRGETPSLLQLGCYVTYLRSFWRVFGLSRVLVVVFEELRANPLAALGGICTAVGVDPGFYTSFSFESHNSTFVARWPWLNRLSMSLEPTVAGLRAHVIHRPALHRVFEGVITAGKRVYRGMNAASTDTDHQDSADLRARLADYYRPYSEALVDELGRSLPWKSLA
jgi:hypothetical protein